MLIVRPFALAAVLWSLIGVLVPSPAAQVGHFGQATHIEQLGENQKPFSLAFLHTCAAGVAKASHDVFAFWHPERALSRTTLQEAPALFRTYPPLLQERTLNVLFRKFKSNWAEGPLSYAQALWLYPRLLAEVSDSSVYVRQIERLLKDAEEAPADDRRFSVAATIITTSPELLIRVPSSLREKIESMANKASDQWEEGVFVSANFHLWNCDADRTYSTSQTLARADTPLSRRRLFLISLLVQSASCFGPLQQQRFAASFAGLENRVVSDLAEKPRLRWQAARKVFEARPEIAGNDLKWFLKASLSMAIGEDLKPRAYALVAFENEQAEGVIRYVTTDADLRRRGISKALIASHILQYPDADSLVFILAETNRAVFRHHSTNCAPDDVPCFEAAFRKTPLYHSIAPLGFTQIREVRPDRRHPRFTIGSD